MLTSLFFMSITRYLWISQVQTQHLTTEDLWQLDKKKECVRSELWGWHTGGSRMITASRWVSVGLTQGEIPDHRAGVSPPSMSETWLPILSRQADTISQQVPLPLAFKHLLKLWHHSSWWFLAIQTNSSHAACEPQWKVELTDKVTNIQYVPH